MQKKREIHVGRTMTIRSLQDDFSSFYPFLKVEFFREPCIKGKRQSKDKLLLPELVFGKIQEVKSFGKIAFQDSICVSELEEKFRKKFGLCMQVFRRSGSVWLETFATDTWSLQQQNEEGESLTIHLQREKQTR